MVNHLAFMGKPMTLKGIVRSGKGDFGYWLKKLERFYTDKTGLRLYPGTLNVHLVAQTFATPANSIRLEREEYGGEVSVSIIPCKIFGRTAFVLRPDTDDGKLGDPPEAILEIATDINLRDAFGLRDGDSVEIDI